MLVVHQTRPAGQAGRWLQNILQPVAEACRFEAAPPLEVRPTGEWGGWCAAETYALDRRVCLSNLIVFCNKEKIISLYLHESCHRLLGPWADEVQSHGPVFFTLNSLLHCRCGSFFKLDYQFARMDFYDLQDQPVEFANFENWQEISIRFARETNEELVGNQCSAEQLAALVVAAWPAFLSKLDQEQAASAKSVKQLKTFSLISANREKYINQLEGWLMKGLVVFGVTVCLFIWLAARYFR